MESPTADMPNDQSPTKANKPGLFGYRPPLGHLIAFGLIAVLGLGIWFYEEVVEERWMTKRFGVVEPELIFRSGQNPAPIVANVLKDHEIKVVVDLTAAKPVRKSQEAEAKAIKEQGITGHRFPMQGDGIGTPDSYAQAVTAIHHAVQANQPVLVHCEAGAQRTGGVVSAYRLLVQGQDSAAVFEEAARYGWDPAEDFEWPRFLNENMEPIAQRLVDAGVIAQVPNPLPIFAPW